jgi:uncharacterized protein YaaW (UPF0174 family)
MKMNICLKKGMSFLLVITMAFFVPFGNANIDPGKRDLPSDFNDFLNNCTRLELTQLSMSLGIFPDIEDDDFGKYGLKSFDQFSDDMEGATADKPLRPSTFNYVSPNITLQAIDSGRISGDLITPDNIKKQLVWTANNKISYLFREVENVDYHNIVQWVAKKKGVSAENRKAFPTFELEKEIIKVYFAQIWDKLTIEQRTTLLRKIELETGTTIENKTGIAAMSGGAAIAALSVTVSMAGFAFYTTMSVVICTVAGWFGITLPFAVYTSASSVVAILSGPVGWIIGGIVFSIGAVLAGLPSADKTASFVMTVNIIKANKLQEK